VAAEGMKSWGAECSYIAGTGYFQIFATHLKAQSEKRDPLRHFLLFPP